MADLSDEYNSSDEDVPVQDANPYETLGEESMLKLVERASELRVITKRNYKADTARLDSPFAFCLLSHPYLYQN